MHKHTCTAVLRVSVTRKTRPQLMSAGIIAFSLFHCCCGTRVSLSPLSGTRDVIQCTLLHVCAGANASTNSTRQPHTRRHSKTSWRQATAEQEIEHPFGQGFSGKNMLQSATAAPALIMRTSPDSTHAHAQTQAAILSLLSLDTSTLPQCFHLSLSYSFLVCCAHIL